MSWLVSLFRARAARRNPPTPFQTALALHIAMAQPYRRLS
jgi:hypothetical protein